MSADKPTAAGAVHDFGVEIFGPLWGAGVERLTGASPETLGRIEAAALEGGDCEGAAEVLASLSKALEALAAKARTAAGTPDDMPRLEARQLGFFSDWYVMVFWPNGVKDRVDGFVNEAHAKGWIASESKAWIAEAKRKRR